MSSSPLRLGARSTPVCANSASTMRSALAIAPVCETAARAPASERPTLKATMGLPAARARAQAARKRGTSRTVSM